MIKPEELRIGILVYDSLRNKQIEVQLNHFKELSISEKSFFERYKPIPLNEEWLLKFGFEKKEVYMLGVKYDGWLNFSFHLDINHINNTFFYHWMGGNIQIMYVHQLQNLFFALCGEELTFKI